jgi:hypothetical protein
MDVYVLDVSGIWRQDGFQPIVMMVVSSKTRKPPHLGVLVTPAFDDAGEDAAADDVGHDLAAARRYDVL